MKQIFRSALLFLAFAATSLRASTVNISSSVIQYTADQSSHWGFAQTAAPQNWDLLYKLFGSSHVVFNYSGNKFDMQQTVPAIDVVQPVIAVGAGLGAYVESAKRVGNLVFRQRMTIVKNPRNGFLADTIQYKISVENNGPVSLNIGARLELDVELIDLSVDGAYLSIDNGISALPVNTIYRANQAPLPDDWWCYDKDPGLSPPTLSSRGVTANNPYGDPATPPDAIEFVHWDEVAGLAFWDKHPSMGQPFWSYPHLDTCVVDWWTGTGQEGDPNIPPSIPLAAGQRVDFITYYGLNQEPFLKSPTPYKTFSPTPTISPTVTISPTFSVSPTISPSFTISPTFSISATFTFSPTISETFSESPTFSFTATHTESPTTTPTPTETLTGTPTVTATPTVSPSDSPTISPTFTISPTPSITPDFSVTPTITETPAHLRLIPRPPNPNPAGGGGIWLPYIVTRDATVRIRIFDISGETVRDLDPFAAISGANEEFWDLRNSSGMDCASGVYIYRIQAAAPGEVQEAWMKCSVIR